MLVWYIGRHLSTKTGIDTGSKVGDISIVPQTDRQVYLIIGQFHSNSKPINK